MKDTMKTDETAIAGSDMLATRYFFVCTAGKAPNGSLSLNNFDVKTTYGFPTLKRLKELSDIKYPNQRDITLISISELSEVDFQRFISEQL